MRWPQGLMGTTAQFVHFLAEEKYKKKPYADYDPCPRPMAWARVTREAGTKRICLPFQLVADFKSRNFTARTQTNVVSDAMIERARIKI